MHYVIFGVILSAGSLLQGAAGFGFGLFSVPLLVWAGAPLSVAVATMSICSFSQSVLASIALRKSIHWKEVLWANALRCLFMPLGIWVLLHIQTLSRDQVKQIIGVLILLALLARICIRVTPRDSIHPLWGWGAFSISGFLNGMVGMGGPPLVLWLMAHRWSNQEFRAFTQTVFALGIPFQMAVLAWMSPVSILKDMGLAFFYVPLVLGAGMVGIRLGNRFSRQALQRLALMLLFATSLMAILQPLWKQIF
ncbi:MAG TPA: sulfite exporter TauE/SafE family protein [Synergistaceae bacterium]|nr:sulfite exporter TauE/SafE family protein [Synergistaceae bacterium]HPJ26461.1 sulfite exporter TauE/SafE family protein [Synergistaceae bacterium]HPQ36639.1 sulfite exporter TauE/SafE family protein [Synergistaceae bacterium]